jgi:hypothetical protein
MGHPDIREWGSGEDAVSADKPTSRRIPWGPLMVVVIGGLLFLLGARRLFLRHHFGLVEALYCCLAIIPAALLLLIFDYVLHHARLVSLMVLFVAVVLVVSSPVFDVALGLALMGAIAGPALGEWKLRLRQPAPANGGENKESK